MSSQDVQVGEQLLILVQITGCCNKKRLELGFTAGPQYPGPLNTTCSGPSKKFCGILEYGQPVPFFRQLFSCPSRMIRPVEKTLRMRHQSEHAAGGITKSRNCLLGTIRIEWIFHGWLVTVLREHTSQAPDGLPEGPSKAPEAVPTIFPSPCRTGRYSRCMPRVKTQGESGSTIR